MKQHRIFSIMLCAALSLSLLVGCGRSDTPTEAPSEQTEAPTTMQTVPETTEPESLVSESTEGAAVLPEDAFPAELIYSSGAGGWFTSLTLEADGTFTGSYHDSELGEFGEGYDSTIYYSNFSGRFTVTGVNRDHTLSLVLSELTLEQEPGEEKIENGVRNVSTGAFGLNEGNSYLLGSPEASPDLLGDAIFSWPGSWSAPVPEELGCWTLLDSAESVAFFEVG